MSRSIKGIRSDLNLKQCEMAERLGLGLSTYQRIEHEEVTPDGDVLIDIADMIGITDVREIRIKRKAK